MNSKPSTVFSAFWIAGWSK